MVPTLLTAVVLGLFAGLAPGPYTTMVAGTALERGFRSSVLLALSPLLTDVPPMLFSALLLERLGWKALTGLGIVGGTIIVLVGLRFLRRHRITVLPGSPERELGEMPSARLTHVIVSGLANPAPWIFWLVVASPLLLRAWSHGPREGAAFVAVFFGTNISSALALAWTASHGRRLLHPKIQRRALQAVGTTLIVVGALILWQSARGDFQSLVDGQGLLKSAVEAGIPNG